MKRRSALVFPLALLLAVAAACGDPEATTATTDPDATEAATTEADASETQAGTEAETETETADTTTPAEADDAAAEGGEDAAADGDGEETAVRPLTPPQTEGPFYPVELPTETDNDLTTIAGGPTAGGRVLALDGVVTDPAGTPLAGIEVEIWQTDDNGAYLHPDDPRLELRDPAFQSYGRVTTDDTGGYSFRTLVPGVYENRPAHIHLKVNDADRELLTSQIYFRGDDLSGDAVTGTVDDDELELLTTDLVADGDGFTASHDLVVQP